MIDRAASDTEYGIESFRNSCIMMEVGQQYNIWMRISVSRDLAIFVFFSQSVSGTIKLSVFHIESQAINFCCNVEVVGSLLRLACRIEI